MRSHLRNLILAAVVFLVFATLPASAHAAIIVDEVVGNYGINPNVNPDVPSVAAISPPTSGGFDLPNFTLINGVGRLKNRGNNAGGPFAANDIDVNVDQPGTIDVLLSNPFQINTSPTQKIVFNITNPAALTINPTQDGGLIRAPVALNLSLTNDTTFDLRRLRTGILEITYTNIFIDPSDGQVPGDGFNPPPPPPDIIFAFNGDNQIAGADGNAFWPIDPNTAVTASFRIIGTADIPEPSTLALLLFAAPVAGWALRRRPRLA